MSASGSLIGTPAYMAPETWRNKPATPQTDIYSLGCILHEMLTGKVLFEGESPAEVMTRHVVDGPEYAEDLPREMRPVLDKALQREPDDRQQDALELLSNVKSCLFRQKTILKTEEYPPEKPVHQMNESTSQAYLAVASLDLQQPPPPSLALNEPKKKRKGFSRLLLYILTFIIILFLFLTFMPASWWCFLSNNTIPGCPF